MDQKWTKNGPNRKYELKEAKKKLQKSIKFTNVNKINLNWYKIIKTDTN